MSNTLLYMLKQNAIELYFTLEYKCKIEKYN